MHRTQVFYEVSAAALLGPFDPEDITSAGPFNIVTMRNCVSTFVHVEFTNRPKCESTLEQSYSGMYSIFQQCIGILHG